MVILLLIFCISLFLIIQGATFATRSAVRLAESFHLSRYTVGFIVVAFISILPEIFVAVDAALTGVPSFGLGVLFGSNIADLTLIFAIIIWFNGRGIKIESNILKNNCFYPFLLLLPVVLGLDGYYSRLEGAALFIIGMIFYYRTFRRGVDRSQISNGIKGRVKSFLMLIASMAVLLAGAHFIVSSATSIARALQISPILIGMLVVGLGTTMPELFFSLKAVKKDEDSLAVGDILGTVLADATLVVGLLALVRPFSFPQKIIYVTGAFMVAASIFLMLFMRSERTLSKNEAFFLFLFWLIFVTVEFAINT